MTTELTIPTNPTELNEMLVDRVQMKKVLEDPAKFAEFIKNYQTAASKNDPAIMDQVKEQTEQVMLNWLREHEVENIRNLNLSHSGKPVKTHGIYNKAALGAKHDKAFTNFSEMLYSISDHSYKDPSMSKLLGDLKNDLSSVKPSDGGYLIPEVLRAQLLETALESAIVRSRATVIPMDSLKVPIPTIDSTSNVSSIFGGIVGYWTEEGATLTESQPRFGRVMLEAHKLTLYTEVPNELIQDSRPAMDALLGRMFPKALAWFEDVAFFVGGGVGEPLGFLNAPATIATTRSTVSAGNNIEWIDIATMYSRMLPQSLDNAVWIIAPDALPSLLTMTIASGTNALWLGGGGFPSAASSPPMSMLGRPVIVSEKARQIGTQGDISFVDLSYYLVGDRQAMSARQSEDFRFQNDITAFRVIERIDGRPWIASAITPQNNSANTLSPFVSLTTAP